MSLPNLSRLSKLSLEDAKCEPCGVTKEKISFLLPGLNLAPGQPEIVLDPEDYECKLCHVSMNYPATGFRQEDGDVFQKQAEFSDLLNPTKDQEQCYHETFLEATAEIRRSDRSRTQIELLFPGCGHQFHKECLVRHITRSPASIRNKCVICFTPIHETILSNLDRRPRSLVRERSAAPTIPESDSDDDGDDGDDDDDDDDNDGPRAQAPRVEREESRDELDMNPLQPAPWFPLPALPPLPAAPGLDENNQLAVAQAVRQYFDDFGRPFVDLMNALASATGPFATNESIRLAKSATVSLRDTSQAYREIYEGRFAGVGDPIHTQWDEHIGKLIFAYHFMISSFDRFDSESEIVQWEGRANYTRIMDQIFPALIRALVPPYEINNPIAYSQLATTWRYQTDVNSGFAFDGGIVAEGLLFMFRDVELSEEVARSALMQTVNSFLGDLPNRTDISRQARWLLTTFTTMLKSALNEAIKYEYRGELQRLYELSRMYIGLIFETFNEPETVELALRLRRMIDGANSGVVDNSPEGVAQGVHFYFTDIQNESRRVQRTLEVASPEFATNTYFTLTSTALNWLGQEARNYRERSPNQFADLGSRLQSYWDEAIGNIVFAHLVMKAALNALDDASPTGLGEGRLNYGRVLYTIRTLIQFLVPSPWTDIIARFQLGTTWRFQIDQDGNALNGSGSVGFEQRLYREVDLSEETQNDVRMQPITEFMTTLNNRTDISQDTRRTFILLTTMLQAAMNKAILNQFTGGTGELQRFHENVTEHLNTLVNAYGNGNLVNLREGFRAITMNALEAIMQQ